MQAEFVTRFDVTVLSMGEAVAAAVSFWQWRWTALGTGKSPSIRENPSWSRVSHFQKSRAIYLRERLLNSEASITLQSLLRVWWILCRSQRKIGSNWSQSSAKGGEGRWL
jgi:hypothetical protein